MTDGCKSPPFRLIIRLTFHKRRGSSKWPSVRSRQREVQQGCLMLGDKRTKQRKKKQQQRRALLGETSQPIRKLLSLLLSRKCPCLCPLKTVEDNYLMVEQLFNGLRLCVCVCVCSRGEGSDSAPWPGGSVNIRHLSK